MRAISQQTHQGIGLLGLDCLETGEGSDVPRFCPEAHEVFAVLVMDQLLLGDFFHLFSQALYVQGDKKKKITFIYTWYSN